MHISLPQGLLSQQQHRASPCGGEAPRTHAGPSGLIRSRGGGRPPPSAWGVRSGFLQHSRECQFQFQPWWFRLPLSFSVLHPGGERSPLDDRHQRPGGAGLSRPRCGCGGPPPRGGSTPAQLRVCGSALLFPAGSGGLAELRGTPLIYIGNKTQRFWPVFGRFGGILQILGFGRERLGSGT